jgi:parallel beta-helix repeat protein
MNRQISFNPVSFSVSLLLSSGFVSLPALANPIAAKPFEPLRVVVNSNQDIAARDQVVTLREAIDLINGDLKLSDLNAAERRQVSRPVTSNETYQNLPVSQIEFQLNANQTTIRLQQLLPAIVKPGIIIDGRNRENVANSIPGFTITATTDDSNDSGATPTIALTTESGKVIARGLTIAANGVTIKNLAIAGFTTRHLSTATEPPADIFITAIQNQDVQLETLETELVPKDITIVNNWLGRLPQGKPELRSAFGVSIFNGNSVTIKGNTIAEHDGSGVITAIQSRGFKIHNNVIENNGLAGMPDALRIEGDVAGGEVSSNTIQNNAGSGLYLFNPKGAIKVYQNRIINNGQRYVRAGIFVTGQQHQIFDNEISRQSGAGIVVAAYPASYANQILNNQFTEVKGLPIDLVSQINTNPNDYQNGDGINRITDSRERGEKTGNAGINAPTFISNEFFLSSIDRTVELTGTTLPNADVDIYKIPANCDLRVNSLNSATKIASVRSDAQDKFSVILKDLKAGDRLVATVTTPNFGTSEMTRPVVVRSLPGFEATGPQLW